jgi:hypothetical protein
MIITQALIDSLHAYYAIALGRTTGLVGSFETVRKHTDGVPNKHKLFSSGTPAVRWLAEKLSEIAETRMLNPDERETLDSCIKLISDWPPEMDWPSLI